MKFIIQNYSSNYHTEPHYFNMVLNMLPNVKSTVWEPSKTSAYDIFDIVQPDIYLTHALLIDSEAIEYMKNNKNIRLVLSVSGLGQKDADNLENLLIDKGINCAFVFCDSSNFIKMQKINVVNINPGVDIFLNMSDLSYNVDRAIIVNSTKEIKDYDGSYHTISANQKIKDNVDICLPSALVSSIIKNYNEVVFRSLGPSTQMLYDIIHYGQSIRLEIDDEQEKEKAINIINKSMKIDFNAISLKEIKQIVKSKHTCLNRTKSLLSQFSSKDQIEHIDTLINQYSEDISV